MGCILPEESTFNKKFEDAQLNFNSSSKYNFFNNYTPKSFIDVNLSSFSGCIENEYILDQHIGEGTFGFSMKIINKKSNYKKCLKILPKDNCNNFCSEDEIKEYFEKLRKLSHENINGIISMFQNEDNYFIVRNYAPQTLYDKVKENYIFTDSQIQNIIRQILVGVTYLHDRKFNHGNIKFENILIFNDIINYDSSAEGYSSNDDLSCNISLNNITNISSNEETNFIIKLNDFSQSEKFLRKNINNSIKFLAPEFWQNNSLEKCDEFSIGVIMYYLYCNKFPFNYKKLNEFQEKLNSKEFENDSKYKELPFFTQDLIQKLLQANPKDRITSKDALKHQYFYKEDQNFFLVEENQNLFFTDLTIIKLMKIFFITIIIFSDNEYYVITYFKSLIKNDKELIELKKDKIKCFLNENSICYNEDNIIKVIEYLFHNKIYLIDDNSNKIFKYLNKFKINNLYKIFKLIVKLFPKLAEINNSQFHSQFKLTFKKEIIKKDLNYEEFKSVLTSYF